MSFVFLFTSIIELYLCSRTQHLKHGIWVAKLTKNIHETYKTRNLGYLTNQKVYAQITSLYYISNDIIKW